MSYISWDPATAQRVTERLAGLYIEENLRDRENVTEDTNRFLESQLQDAKRRLLEHEQKLEEYRRRYAGQLPSQLPGNLQAIQNAQMQMQSLSESVNRARERRLLVERQLADAQVSTAPSPQPSTTRTRGTGHSGERSRAAGNSRGQTGSSQAAVQARSPGRACARACDRQLRARVAEDAKRSPVECTG